MFILLFCLLTFEDYFTILFFLLWRDVWEKISNILNDLKTSLFSKYRFLGTTVWKCGLKLHFSTTSYRILWSMEYTKASDMPGSAKTCYLSVLWSFKHIWMKRTLTWKIKTFLQSHVPQTEYFSVLLNKIPVNTYPLTWRWEVIHNPCYYCYNYATKNVQ